jgi:hypothetical protein
LNIFFLSSQPRLAARYQIDRHVVKMPTESMQILSTVCRVYLKRSKDAWFKATHPNHPCVKWAVMSQDNFYWLMELTRYLCEEYSFRYGRVHESSFGLKFVNRSLKYLPDIGFTRPALTMADECKIGSPVASYREFYRTHKKYDRSGRVMAVWSKREAPYWWGAA